VNSSLNFTICDGNVTIVQNSTRYFGEQFGNISNTTNMTNALNAIADIMSTMYPLTYSCYYGLTETGLTAEGYAQTLVKPQSLLFNSINSVGQIYDTVYYLLGWTSQDKIDIQTNDEMKAYWYRTGAYFGILTTLLLVD